MCTAITVFQRRCSKESTESDGVVFQLGMCTDQYITHWICRGFQRSSERRGISDELPCAVPEDLCNEVFAALAGHTCG